MNRKTKLCSRNINNTNWMPESGTLLFLHPWVHYGNARISKKNCTNDHRPDHAVSNLCCPWCSFQHREIHVNRRVILVHRQREQRVIHKPTCAIYIADLTIYRRQTNRNRSKRGRQLLSGATLHHITLADPRQGGARDTHPLVRGPISFILMQF